MKNLHVLQHPCHKEIFSLSEVFIFLIRIYQYTLSLEHGILGYLIPYRVCRFFPLCSDYAIAALRHYGFLKGSKAALKRILRCNPWCASGYDPV